MDHPLKSKADALRALHLGGSILVLANAWDVASALVLEHAGAKAIATTSAGIAFALGYPDGQRISREEMLGTIERMARAVRVPLTADVESGYGERPEDAAETARGVIAAGAVGLNLEDGTDDAVHPLVDLSLAVEKIRAVCEVGHQAGVPLLVNARTDVYLNQVGAPVGRFHEAMRRAIAFREAGANCIFLPGLSDSETIARFARELQCPINILVGPGSPTIHELQKLGVARVSLGSKTMLAAVTTARRVLEELLHAGSYNSLEGILSYGEMTKLLAPPD
jgi:2-methylisocitrate lyase-like PEP mutase family enzyme